MNALVKSVSLIALCCQGHAFAQNNASFDPATNVLQLPVVEVGSGSQTTCVEATLALSGSGQFTLTGAKPLTCLQQLPEPTKQDAEKLKTVFGKWSVTFKQTGKPDVTTTLDVSNPQSTHAFWSPFYKSPSKSASLDDLIAGKGLQASNDGTYSGSSSVRAYFPDAYRSFTNPYSSSPYLRYSPYTWNWSSQQPESAREPFDVTIQIDNTTAYSVAFNLTATGTIEGRVMYMLVSAQACTPNSNATGDFSYQSLPSGVSITMTGTRI